MNINLKDFAFTNNIKEWYISIADWFNVLLFDGMPTTSPIVYSVELTNKMTKLFDDAIVNVYIMESKRPYIFTFPAQPKTTERFALRFRNSFFTISWLLNFCGAIESLLTAVSVKSVGLHIDQLIYNKKTNKFSINIPEVTIYISSALISILNNNPDECVAIMLSEVGQNIYLGRHILRKLLNMPVIFNMALPLLKLLNSKDIYIDKLSTSTDRLNAIVDNPVVNSFWNMNDNAKIVSDDWYLEYINKVEHSVYVLILAITFGYFLSTYIARRTQQYSDEFAVKCGYGEAFTSAIQKVHNFIFDSSFKSDALSNFNMLDRAFHFVNKCFYWINNILAKIGLSSRLATFDREKLSAQATDIFNNDPNIGSDRTRPIIRSQRSYNVQEAIDRYKQCYTIIKD